MSEFYCKKLKKIQGQNEFAVKSDWGWLCDCGDWYDPESNVERRYIEKRLESDDPFVSNGSWFITPTEYNRHEKLYKEI